MFTSAEILQQRYQLQQALGRTAAGRQTWLATDLHSNEKVVVKLLAFSPQMEWQELKLFEREAQVLQSINHNRIPQYRDYFSIDREAGSGLPWFGLVQDYIPGFSLQELLEKGQRFSQEQVQYITIKILNILVYLHQLSPPVLHRDLKPSNLILGEDNNIYLVDFGAVQAQAHVTGVTFTVVGTSGYAPLEQFWGRAVAASDLYALGATLIHLVTGTPPADLPQKNSRIQFSDRVSLDPNFVSWIEKMTEISLEERFQTAQEALKVLISGEIRHSSYTEGSSLRQVLPPCDTRIQLHKSSEKLQIQYLAPATNEMLGCFFVFILMISLSSGSLFFGIVIVIVSTSVLNKIPTELEQTLVNIDRDFLKVYRPFLSKMIESKEIKVSEIFEVLSKEVEHQDQLKINQYQLMICYRDQSYPLDGYFQEEECLWLAQEIQNWLNSQQV